MFGRFMILLTAACQLLFAATFCAFFMLVLAYGTATGKAAVKELDTGNQPCTSIAPCGAVVDDCVVAHGSELLTSSNELHWADR